jgi:hypothetical protein
MQQALELQFPRVHTDVETCSHSLSGFRVRVHFIEHEMSVYFTTSAFIAVLAAITAYCLNIF